jgi:RNA polymerase sigma-70 factor (ECF subfamily)
LYEEVVISLEHSNEIDQDLMRRFRSGDEEAFQSLFNCYAPPVINFAYRFLHSQAEAEDLAQEVFLRVYKGRERYDDNRPFKPWLFAIASRLISNHLRNTKRHHQVSLDYTPAEDEAPLASIIPEKSLRPDQQIDQQEKVRAVQAALDGLPENQRTAVLLARFEEMSYEDIAEVMGVSITAVKSLLFRAKQTLKDTLSAFVSEGKRL